MTRPPTGSLATGLYWHAGEPALAVTDPASGGDRDIPLQPGATVGWRLTGPRRCTGVWLPDRRSRRPCPYRASIPDTGTAAQCPACTAADPGRQLARDHTTDRRSFRVYLAWFGPDLIKVGITAADRGHDRLTEQGAFAFTWLAHGPHAAARAVEHAATAAGVPDRISRRTRLAGWSQPAEPDLPRRQLSAVYQRLSTEADARSTAQPLPCQIHDLTHHYGLTSAPPAATAEVTGVCDGTIMAATVTCLIGRDAVLHIDDHLLLTDLRLLSGWTLTAHPGPSHGLHLAARHPDRTRHASGQDTLF